MRADAGRLRRVVLVAAIVVVVLVAGVLTIVVLRDPVPGPEGRRGVPERSFAWLRDATGQFTDAQIASLASRYGVVVLDRPHARANMRAQLDDIRRLKAANPRVRALLYVNASLWYDTNDTPAGWGTRYDRAWSLRDRTTGEILRFTGVADRPIADFVDLGNPAYRTYLLALVAGWVAASGADGVAFDSAVTIDADLPVPAGGGRKWGELVDRPTIAAYDAGLVDLLDRARAGLGPGRTVLYNGIADRPASRGRNLGLLAHADMTVDEEFCLDLEGRYDAGTLLTDLALARTIAARGKQVLWKTNSGRVPPGDLERIGRFCSGAFLLGWQPGSSFYKFGPDYSPGELSSDPPLAEAPVGRPRGEFRAEGGLLLRDFDGGTVVVNPTGAPRQVPPGEGGIVVGGMDAAVLLRPSTG